MALAGWILNIPEEVMADEILTPAIRFAQTANLPVGVYSADDMGACVTTALLRYGEDRPQELVGLINGDGGSEYDLSAAGLTAWDEDSSSVMEVATPYSIADENVLGLEDWKEVDDPTDGRVLFLIELSTEVDDNIRVRYSAPWTESAVPTKHVHGVAMLAAGYYFKMLAARFAQSGESSISADVFNRQSASQTFRNLARDYFEQYGEIVGEATKNADTGPKASVGIIQIDADDFHGGQGRLIDPEMP